MAQIFEFFMQRASSVLAVFKCFFTVGLTSLASLTLLACSGATQTSSVPITPDKSFNSQPNPDVNVVTIDGNSAPNIRHQNHSAQFSNRSIEFQISEQGLDDGKLSGTNLNVFYVDGENMTNSSASAYLTGLFSNLRNVEVSELICDDWVKVGCNLMFEIKADKVLNDESVSCSVVINMENQVTDSCGL